MLPTIGLAVITTGVVVALYVVLRALEIWRREPKGSLVAVAAVVGVLSLAAIPALVFFAWNLMDLERTNAILNNGTAPLP